MNMMWLHDLAYFGGGVTLINAVPHLVSGVTGRPFQTPFAKPPGKGLSSSAVNVIWGFANLVVAYGLICQVGDFDLRALNDAAAVGLGLLLAGIGLALTFGRLHGGNAPGSAGPSF
jgi:hypothetical protein